MGDVCDPHPVTARDCLLLFDSFNEPEAFDAHWAMMQPSGAVRRGAGHIVLEPSGAGQVILAALDADGAPLTQPSDAQLVASASSGTVSVGVGVAPVLGMVGGFRCGIYGMPPSQGAESRFVGYQSNGNFTVATTMGPIPPTVGTRLLLHVRTRTSARQPAFVCDADYGIEFVTTPDPGLVLVQDPAGAVAVLAAGAAAEMHGITASTFVAETGTCPPELRR
jgi:hypothetical protein